MMGPQALQDSVESLVPKAVLDTNAVLAWLWFHDPAVNGLSQALQTQRLEWIATIAMRRELDGVLRGLSQRRGSGDADSVLIAFDGLALIKAESPAAHGLRCSDGTDQMFVDLAIAQGARWLFSRDRALLKLRRRAACLGLVIAPPETCPRPD